MAKMKSGDKNDPIGVYIHIPFCQRKCPYCHFAVTANRPNEHLQFIQALHAELTQYQTLLANRPIRSIYLGGGTPSLLDPDCIATILSWFAPTKGCEITLEANPDSLDRKRAVAYHQTGVNRLSIGLQSLDDRLLQAIGREHNASQALSSVEDALAAGFDNVSVDVMLDLPNQTSATVLSTIDQLTILPISHLSLYNLVLEPPSLFYRQKKQIEPQMPKDSESLKMLELSVQRLEAAQFRRYELSAFARRGKRAVHNTAYWTGHPFVGFGPSAFSYVAGKRWRNTLNVYRYQAKVSAGETAVDFSEKLPPDAHRRELLSIGLRLTEGISLSEFQPLPHNLDNDLFALEKDGLIERNDNCVRLTARGKLFYDTVASTLV